MFYDYLCFSPVSYNKHIFIEPRLVFQRKTHCVVCGLETESLFIIEMNFSLQRAEIAKCRL